MVSMLNLSRNRSAIARELFRRIGYTNGLHDIYRFARVGELLHPKIPSSTVALRAALMDQESVGGSKYAQGVIDVAGALGLLEKVGSNVSLSDRGYSLHAIETLDSNGDLTRAFALMVVLEADGEATLNLLDLMTNEPVGRPDIGTLLMARLLRIMDSKQSWAEKNIMTGFARSYVVGEIIDARKKLESALDPEKKRATAGRASEEERSLTPEQRVRRFIDHTVVPRKGWLLQLGCMTEVEKNVYRLTPQGLRLLEALKSANAYKDSVFVLPMSAQILDTLGVSDSPANENLFRWSVAESLHGDSVPYAFEMEHLLHEIECIYPHVRLHAFNEATISSLYHALACSRAIVGHVFTETEFQQQISGLVRRFPEKIFRLRQRYGQSGYIALKN